MYEKVEINSERWFDLTPLLNEKFKNIKDYEEDYQISNYGRVKSIKRFKEHANQYFDKEMILKLCKERWGYFQVHLCKKNRKKWVKIHRLVAQAFIPNPNNLPQVNHKDGNKQNNRTDNLEWCTASYNTIHAYKSGLNKPSTSSVDMFDINGNYKCSFESIKEAGKYISRTYGSICSNLVGKTKKCGGYVFKYKRKKLKS